MAWKNGLGTTDEIAIDPPDAAVGGAFSWRLSMATVGQSCSFSAFPGYERAIMVIEGAGMELEVPGQPTRRLDKLFDPFMFSGDEPAQCRLIAGAVRDLNLMTARAQWRSRTEVLRAGDTRHYLEADGDVVILHCFQGTIDVAVQGAADHETLPSLHTLVVDRRMPSRLALIVRPAATFALISLLRI